MTGLNSTKTSDCLECGRSFNLPRAGKSPHICPACRREEFRAYQADRYKQIKEGVWDRIADPADVSLNFDQFAASVLKDDRLPIATDRQPVGYLTPAGSDDGTSTFFKDLAADLEWSSKVVAKHEWWEQNGHWSYQLDNPHAVKKIKGES